MSKDHVPVPKCSHEPDLNNLLVAEDCALTMEDGRLEIIIDVNCIKCGTSGSFAVTVRPEDINW